MPGFGFAQLPALFPCSFSPCLSEKQHMACYEYTVIKYPYFFQIPFRFLKRNNHGKQIVENRNLLSTFLSSSLSPKRCSFSISCRSRKWHWLVSLFTHVHTCLILTIGLWFTDFICSSYCSMHKRKYPLVQKLLGF